MAAGLFLSLHGRVCSPQRWGSGVCAVFHVHVHVYMHICTGNGRVSRIYDRTQMQRRKVVFHGRMTDMT